MKVKLSMRNTRIPSWFDWKDTATVEIELVPGTPLADFFNESISDEQYAEAMRIDYIAADGTLIQRRIAKIYQESTGD